MVQREVYDCDRCGRPDIGRPSPPLPNSKYFRLDVATGRGLDPAGSTETHWETVDLCAVCMRDGLVGLLRERDTETGRKFVIWAKRWNGQKLTTVGEEG